MDKSELGNRMKTYESVTKNKLMRRNPIIIRLDGKAFSKFTKGMKKPFDDIMVKTMQYTMKYLCENIQGCVLGYTQSDEISLLLIDYNNLYSESWFDNNIQKIVSISSSMATLFFNKSFRLEVENLWAEQDDLEYNKYIQLLMYKKDKAMFDSRVFSIPKEEVNNYFLWRQKDASKNSISMVAQSKYSHSQLQNKNGSQKQEMLFQDFGINWNNLPTTQKRGSCCIKNKFILNKGLKTECTRNKWIIDEEIPQFNKNVEYINKLVFFR